MIKKNKRILNWLSILLMTFLGMTGIASAKGDISDAIDERMEPVAEVLEKVVFVEIPVTEDIKVPVVLIVLAGTALFLTLYFKFLNIRGIGMAIRTVKGKYTRDDAPGQITHFQALSAALSATVGLGNIAGVGVAIGLGGPGAMVWMIFLGLCGMTTKFCECTLGVKYREFDEHGQTHGGAMYYLSKGFGERGLGGLGKVLAVFFAFMCIGGAIGAGNMFQVNQAHSQFSGAFGLFTEDSGHSIWFGVILAILVGLVIIGGIKSIARVTSLLVPFMCVIYIIAALTIILTHLGDVIPAFKLIFTSAFTGEAVAGGFVGVLIQGVKRAAFSNEAGIGSAPIAHSAVKTDKPASEGLVALLEPFTDTVVVCTMTALVLVITGAWKVDAIAEKDGVQLYETPNAIVRTVSANESLELVKKSEDEKFYQAKFTDEENGKTKEVLAWVNADIVSVSGAEGEGDAWHAKGKVSVSSADVYAKASAEVKPVEVLAEGATMRLMDKSKDGQFLKVYREDGDNLWMKEGSVELIEGIDKTSMAFGEKFEWFPKVLAVAVLLFAFSTMISWSFYGEQAVGYIFGKNNFAAVIVYKVMFCVFVVVGVTASLSNVIRVSDAMLFAMVLPNMIGLYFLLPIVRKELTIYREHMRKIDAGGEK
ncbi:amino acid carrier protein [Rubritalea squalenifaciens DSM 18772]|uniref:Amino acid carrier protein n=1 Tax=Rubritalea squalenifaciens DSM 18772 TaxID=1123071 RepID=A0A1M6N826_9BACT|nr:alanine/glycine:cation symporter family protein [Rubritalea squalenifaciens]SHJ91859.1 amino acid carrier protein [Rubritalea squalenifaciens DSM 18772]